MQYFFILGQNFELNKQELKSFLKIEKVDFKIVFEKRPVLIIESKKDLDKIGFEKSLGGLIKFGQIIKQIESVEEIIDQEFIKLIFKDDKKIFFGISPYLFNFNLKKIGLEIKKLLKAKGFSSRFVSSKEKVLSSVIVQKEILNKKGIELVLIKEDNNIFIGQTLAVQLFEEFIKRDFTRPERDLYSGMLPPKVARIMVNLAKQKKEALILDPFCGHGTILQELVLLGYNNLYGSDISEKAVKGTKINLKWLKTNLQLKTFNLQLFKADARNISKDLKAVDAIITEPYLGPPLKGRESFEQIEKNIKELEGLYQKALEEFLKILKPSGKVVMIIPQFKIKNKVFKLNFNKVIPKEFDRLDNNELVYTRPDQRVVRQIVLLGL